VSMSSCVGQNRLSRLRHGRHERAADLSVDMSVENARTQACDKQKLAHDATRSSPTLSVSRLTSSSLRILTTSTDSSYTANLPVCSSRAVSASACLVAVYRTHCKLITSGYQS